MDSAIHPLVSVPVITYNSSKTVVETLDSIYNQTYRNLELIVSDDCSTDNTVDICREWIAAHKERFVRTELLTVEKNTGVSGNMNRAERACQGEWIKVIAGDDLLMPKCVETNVNYIKEHEDAIYVFSKVEVFGNSQNVVDGFVNEIFDYSFFDLLIENQYNWLIMRNFQPIPAATGFYNRNKLIELGIGYDERIPMLEDWPRWIRLLEKGIRFAFVDEVLVKYRVSENSICSGEKYRDRFQKSIALLYIFYQHAPYIRRAGRFKGMYRYSFCKALLSGSWYWRLVYGGIRAVTVPKRIIKRIGEKLMFRKKFKNS